MKLKTLGMTVAVGSGLLLGSAPQSVAHHSFAAEFDANRPIELTGIVREMRFSNPHSWIYVTVTTSAGETEEWAIEGAAPNALLRRGFSRTSLPAGTEIHVKGFQARDRTNRASGTAVTLLADGSQLFVGATGIGAAPGTQESTTD